MIYQGAEVDKRQDVFIHPYKRATYLYIKWWPRLAREVANDCEFNGLITLFLCAAPC
jgi:hypothetical protein